MVRTYLHGISIMLKNLGRYGLKLLSANLNEDRFFVGTQFKISLSMYLSLNLIAFEMPLPYAPRP